MRRFLLESGKRGDSFRSARNWVTPTVSGGSRDFAHRVPGMPQGMNPSVTRAKCSRRTCLEPE